MKCDIINNILKFNISVFKIHQLQSFHILGNAIQSPVNSIETISVNW